MSLHSFTSKSFIRYLEELEQLARDVEHHITLAENDCTTLDSTVAALRAQLAIIHTLSRPPSQAPSEERKP